MKHINKIIVTILFFGTVLAYGQRGAGMDKIKSLKIAFITERLNLSSDEAAVFWPVYNEHEEALEQLRMKERMEIRRKLRNFDSMTEQEVRDLMNEFLQLENEKNEKNMAFIKKMMSLISAKKTFLLIRAEEDFKKRLIQQIQQRRQ